ncbi:MAG TPA: hypothetical protein VNL17_02090 [Verrucomicrobiae bacterium]|nr:hypothetical protein [Verrucomicrobiae bacterium]
MEKILKGIVRLLGLASGLLGLLCLISCAAMLVILLHDSKDAVVVLLGIVGIISSGLFGAYFLCVAFVVWRQFSPAAVHHISAVVALVLFGVLINRLADPRPILPPSFEGSLGDFALFGSCIAVSFLVFRLFRFMLNRGLFPTQQVETHLHVN